MTTDNNEPKTELIIPREGVLAETIGAEIDQQITTAKRYPRSITRAVEEIGTLATLDKDTAEACRYALKRSNKVIDGPSVRFAEILAHSWTNCRFGARVVGYDRKHITAQGFFADLEKNTAATVDVKRRITDRTGRTYGDDMIAVTAQAASSIAMRNAIFAGIPRALWEAAYKAVVSVIEGDAKTLGERRGKMLEVLTKAGVSEQRIFAACGAEGIDDVNTKRLAFIRALWQAVVDGEATAAQQFPEPAAASGDVLGALADKKKQEGEPVAAT